MLELAHFSGSAEVHLFWELQDDLPAPEAAPADPATLARWQDAGGQPWSVEYFANPAREGFPLAFETAPPDGISRNYDAGPPATSLPADGWSARWTRVLELPDGDYRFTLRADDAAALWIDDREVVSAEDFAAGGPVLVEAIISGGRHVFRLEHWDLAGGANLFLTWEPPFGTTLLPDGCNGAAAGVNGNAPPCPGQSAGLVVENPVTFFVTVRAGRCIIVRHLRRQRSLCAFCGRGSVIWRWPAARTGPGYSSRLGMNSAGR
ncbi:MAG: hypothetical protein HC915_09290 [Anaerolineae bacterium]|nr:hypothetical protein [Anaerolineae bacterium]